MPPETMETRVPTVTTYESVIRNSAMQCTEMKGIGCKLNHLMDYQIQARLELNNEM